MSSVTYDAKTARWQCASHHPKRKFSLKTGTVLEDSPIATRKMVAGNLACYQLQERCFVLGDPSRTSESRRKTAWFMLQRARLALQGKNGGKLSGEIEADESFIGGKARNMHAKKRAEKIHGRGPDGKAIVAAVLERGGEIRAKVVKTRRKNELYERGCENVEAGSNVYTDALKSYDGLDEEFKHQVVDHAETYVRGKVHTNGCENFWSLQAGDPRDLRH